MQGMIRVYQQNKYYVNPVYVWQWGLFADGKMHCENRKYL